MKVFVACGGTGGHIFPGLATANVLSKHGHDVVLIVAGKEVESITLKGWNGRVIAFRAGGLTGVSLTGRLLSLFRIAGSIFRCRSVMRRERPDVVLAMGSYASVGPVLAASMLGVPAVLHESNAIPGRAVRFLEPRASKIAVGFRSAEKFFKKGACLYTGFPLRKLEVDTFRGDTLKKDLFTILVMGGSQGAHSINELLPPALALLKGNVQDFQVLHLAGANDEESVRKAYGVAGIKAVVFGFLENMGKAYGSVDLAVSRAGAASCAEQALFNIPSILIPLPSAADDHQTANAKEIEAVGGAVKLDQVGLTPKFLADKIGELMRDENRLAAMRDALKRNIVDDGAERLAELVEAAAIRKEL